ncbi:MAG: hypothetical protein JNJ90_01570 [Saprospiraceae bacterium]|jgi:hypothetical protein|nr:hypothetical protein [Saprospiraceae bacterium]
MNGLAAPIHRPTDIQLTPAIFWDTKFAEIDLDKNAPYVIDRVLHYGTWADWKRILGYYGKEKIKTVALNLRYMDKRVLAYCSVFFDVPKEMFRCYNTEPSLQRQWSY